jgi:hypothetical protein
MAKRTKTIADLDAAEKRWKTRMKRAFTALDRIDQQRRRLAAKTGAPMPTTKPVIAKVAPQRHVTMIGIAGPAMLPAPAPEPEVADAVEIVKAVADDGFDIPGFLRRARGTPAEQAEAAQRKTDRETADAIRAADAERKTAKARGRIATMKAKKAGDTKRMPLTGKAALDMIRNG